jgi:5,10-methylenetetrahydrofolate reductase
MSCACFAVTRRFILATRLLNCANLDDMSRLSEKIAARQFVITTELTPPKGIDLTDIFAKADALKRLVDAINLTESPRARMAIEPKSVARLLIERGVEPIVQFTARDRNRIALQSDILGAAALGVGNVVFMAGDSPMNGDHPDAKAVFDLNTSQMLAAARALNGGHDLAGNELTGAPNLFLGATANPGAADMDAEVLNTRRKVDAGAQFLQTQAVYDAQSVVRFASAAKLDGVALIAGIIPLKSAKMASWLNANVPGIHVPASLIKEMDAVAGDADAELRTSIAITARIIDAIKPHCAGVHLMMMGWEKHIPAFLAASALKS